MSGEPLQLDGATRAQLEAVIDHLNANYADAVLLVARHLAGDRLDDAELHSVDRLAARFTGMLGGANRVVRLDFPAPCTTVDEVQVRLMEAVAAARAQAATEPLTSLEAELAANAGLPTRTAVVAGKTQLTPNLLEVTLAGLDDYSPLGGDECHFVLTSEDREGLCPTYTIADYQAQGQGGPVRGAYYTTRRARPEAGEIDLWVVLHDHPDSVGGWFQRAGVGHRLALWGPRRSFRAPADTRSLLLVADESGIAAAAGLIDELPDLRITAVLETVDAGHRPPLPARNDVTVHWVDRGRQTPGTGTALLEATRSVTAVTRFDAAFGAAESRTISAVRRHLRADLGLAAVRVLMTGYWRHTG